MLWEQLLRKGDLFCTAKVSGRRFEMMSVTFVSRFLRVFVQQVDDLACHPVICPDRVLFLLCSTFSSRKTPRAFSRSLARL